MTKAILTKVLNEIKPTSLEHKEFEKLANELTSKIEDSIKKLKFDCKVFIGGSFGKGTYLKGTSDVDIFCRFDKKYDDIELSVYLKLILIDAKIDFKKQKGSRDYYSGEYKSGKVKIKFEAVPVRFVNFAKDAVNSTDVSALHVEFVKSKIAKNKEISNEIRLAKQFFKSHNLYGAESYIGAFSGHVIDILICHFGSLKSLLEDAKTWDETKFVDISKFYKSEKDALFNIEEDKHSRLIVVDPIVKERNAARALSVENYNKFLLVAHFFEKFSENDFKVKKESRNLVLKRKQSLAKKNNLKSIFYLINFEIENESEDIVGSKLLKLSNLMKARFESFDFIVFTNSFFIDMSKGECLFDYQFENTTLSNIKEIKGPQLSMKQAVKGFLNVRNNYFVREDRLYSYEKRKITKLGQVIKFSKADMQKLLNKEIKFVKKVLIKK